MSNTISIKEARTKKGLSLTDISKALNIDQSIIDLLEKDQELPEKYKSYRSSYIKSIYKYLGHKTFEKNHIKSIPVDNTMLILTTFFFIFSLVILVFLSSNIYFKYNNQILKKTFEKDIIFENIDNFLSSNNSQYIEHEFFLNSLYPIKRSDYSQKFILIPRYLKPVYYKTQNINKKTIEFGEILLDEPLVLDLDSDFLIDISNIRYIDKIIFRGIEYKIEMNSDYYLKNFNINKLEKLL